MPAITKFEFYEVIVPAHAGAIASKSIVKPLHKLPVGAKPGWSVQFDQLPKIIIRMECADGTVGWGECYRGHDWRVVEQITNILLGQELKDLTLQKLPFNFSREYDGFECAIYDAYAKVHGLRVVDLLGGAVRSAVKIGAWSSHRELEEIPELAQRFSEQGFDCIKFKCDLEDDVAAWCTLIKEADPNMKVILDPNERWETAGDSRPRIQALGEIGNVLCLEDPIPRWQLHDYRMLRNSGAVPIVLHVSLPYILHGQRIEDAIKALNAEAVDGFNFNAGMANFQRLDHIATAAGLPCWHGSEIDLGILEAMYVHSAMAATSCSWPSDIFGRLIREHDLLEAPLKIEPPFVHLPAGLGLGVQPDLSAIQKYQKDYKTWQVQ